MKSNLTHHPSSEPLDGWRFAEADAVPAHLETIALGIDCTRSDTHESYVPRSRLMDSQLLGAMCTNHHRQGHDALFWAVD